MAKPYIKGLALARESWAPNTLYARWNVLSVKQKQKGVSKPKKKYETVDHYEYYWWYKIPGESRMFRDNGWTSVGASITTATYSIPDNAIQVGFVIKPISKKYKKDKKEKSYWTGSESKKDIKLGTVAQAPSAPTVTLEDTKLTARLDNLPIGITQVKFQIFQDDNGSWVWAERNIDVSTRSAAYQVTINAGHTYKVRCRMWGNGYSLSDWSEFSSRVEAIPLPVTSFTEIRAASSTSVHLSWPESSLADSYEIEYVTKLENFDRTTAQNATATINQIILNLETGHTYYFRIRAVKGSYKSAWYPSDPWDVTKAQSITIGKLPTAPTTWSLVSSIQVGDIANFYWIHNAQDNSVQEKALIEFKFIGAPGGTKTEQREIPNTNYGDEDRENENLHVSINTGEDYSGTDISGNPFTITFSDGVTIEWRVRTKGVVSTGADGGYGPWSVVRKLEIYGRPFINMFASSELEGWIWDPFRFAVDTIYTAAQLPVRLIDNVLTSFPIGVSIESGPINQTPVGYYLEIIAKDGYEYEDYYGKTIVVGQNEVLYSRYFNSDRHSIVRMITASDVRLEEGQTYILRATVTMNSGLSKTSDDFEFTVDWEEIDMYPNARVGIDPDFLYASITPYCYDRFADDDIDVEGEPVEEEEHEDEEDDEGDPVLVENVTLTVYRIDVDGEFTLIASDIPNDETSVVDPHPTLDYVDYLVVALNVETGKMAFQTIRSVEVPQPGIVMTWAEHIERIKDSDGYDEDVVVYENDYSGVILKLPYNVDVNESHSPDVALVNYIGRKRSVSYYGTHLGETASWKTDIPKSDEDTIKLLRRLAKYTGDVYVRESQSRTGYWANVTATFDINHNALIVPVSFSITRVEGGA